MVHIVEQTGAMVRDLVPVFRACYEAAIENGFNEDQAMQLTLTTVRQILGDATKPEEVVVVTQAGRLIGVGADLRGAQGLVWEHDLACGVNGEIETAKKGRDGWEIASTNLDGRAVYRARLCTVGQLHVR